MPQQILKSIWEFTYNVIIIVTIVVIIRTFLISPFHVSGNSMVPTLRHNDYIIIDKLSYFAREPKFGDVIVFTPPNPRMSTIKGVQCFITKVSAVSFSEETCNTPDFFIKRVMGVGGDTLEIREGDVLRNGELLAEEYLDEFNSHRTFIPEKKQEKTYEVPEGKYFVLGDNRNGSSDSRAHSREWLDTVTGKYIPYVNREDIEGRLFFTLVSPEKIQEFLK
ncbi:signal peptidase I [Candidatus Peregrinibacteria bacterium]|nr:signal peptidase I [Candidatus Peregrinibacteria bacterium]